MSTGRYLKSEREFRADLNKLDRASKKLERAENAWLFKPSEDRLEEMRDKVESRKYNVRASAETCHQDFLAAEEANGTLGMRAWNTTKVLGKSAGVMVGSTAVLAGVSVVAPQIGVPAGVMAGLHVATTGIPHTITQVAGAARTTRAVSRALSGKYIDEGLGSRIGRELCDLDR